MVKLDLRFSYCISVSGALKWIEMMVSAVVIGLVLWEVVKSGDPQTHHMFDGEIYTCATAMFTFVIVFILLFVYFCVCGDGSPSSRRRLYATLIYTLLEIMWIAAAGVEVWLCIDLKDKKGINGPKYNRRPAAAAFCFINVICCGISLYFAQFKDL